MEEEPITQNEINSELTGLNKGEKKEKKKKLIIYISVSVTFCYFTDYNNNFINKRKRFIK